MPARTSTRPATASSLKNHPAAAAAHDENESGTAMTNVIPEIVRVVENARAVNPVEHHVYISQAHAGVVLDDAVDRLKNIQPDEEIDQPVS